MKNETDLFFEKSFDALHAISSSTDEQKEAVLQKVLLQSQSEKASPLQRLKNIVVVYPWRVAFGASGIQTIICTILFGSNYTNFILQWMGR